MRKVPPIPEEADEVLEMANLYAPRDFSIPGYKIEFRFLPYAEEFEKRRSTDPPVKHVPNYTANVVVNDSEMSPDPLKRNLEMYLSFAQSRDVEVLRTRKDFGLRKSGSFHKGLSNAGDPLIKERFLPEFMAKVLNNSEEMSEEDEEALMRALIAHRAANSNIPEVKFIFSWMALEGLAENNYEEFRRETDNDLVKSMDKSELQEEIREFLEEKLSDGDQVEFLQKRLSSDYLYEHSSTKKVQFLIEHLNIGLKDHNLYEFLRDGERYLRHPLAHELDAENLRKLPTAPNMFRELHTLILFRKMGISPEEIERYGQMDSPGS